MGKVRLNDCLRAKYDALASPRNANTLFYTIDTDGARELFLGDDQVASDVILLAPDTVPVGAGKKGKLYLSIVNGGTEVAMYTYDGTGYLPTGGSSIAGIDNDTTPVTNLQVASFKASAITTIVSALAASVNTKLPTEKAVATAIDEMFNAATWNTTTQTLTLSRPSGNDVVVDFVIESLIEDINYNSTTKELTITLVSGATTVIDLGDLVDLYTGLQTNSIGVTVSGNDISADLRLDPNASNLLTSSAAGVLASNATLMQKATAPTSGNVLSTDANGQAVDSGTALTNLVSATTNTQTVAITKAANSISASVIVSATAGNSLSAQADGLYVSGLEWETLV